VALSLNNIALLYNNQGKYAEAEPLYKHALEIQENSLGPEHPAVALSLNNIAGLYRAQGRYAEADPLYKRALEIMEKSLGPEHPSVATNLKNLAHLYGYRREYQVAIDFAYQAYMIDSKVFDQNVCVLKEKDALRYGNQKLYAAYLSLSLFQEINEIDSSLHLKTADLIIDSKGTIADEIIQRNRSIIMERDSSLQSLAEEYRYALFRHANVMLESPGDNLEMYRNKLDSLQHVVDSLESELAIKSASFRKRIGEREPAVSEVMTSLPKESVLIDFMKYGYISIERDTVIDHYIAMALTHKGKPLIIELGSASIVDSLISEYQTHMQFLSSQDNIPTEANIEYYNILSHSIYGKVLKPFEDVLKDAEIIFISPDGALNMVSFAGLIDEDGKYLIERFPIHYLSSSRDILRIDDIEEISQGLLALGDPDFDAGLEARLGAQIKMPGDTISEDDRFVTRSARSGYGKFEDLRVPHIPRSGEELDMVLNTWDGSGPDSAIVFRKSQACEDHFKRFAPNKKVIHLSTHGYYFEGLRLEPRLFAFLDEFDFVPYQNPLLLSGLLFAGCNLHGEGVDSVGLEDGILSAYEVSAMDLSGVDLVVLSACETGLGKVERGEGVYGLRRAFLMAGAKTVVSSLWEVPDKETSEMLGSIYESSDKPIYERLRDAQLSILNKLRNDGLPDHPYLWAGFIAIGDWH
jgi:CHAT domain-containing protein